MARKRQTSTSTDEPPRKKRRTTPETPNQIPRTPTPEPAPTVDPSLTEEPSFEFTEPGTLVDGELSVVLDHTQKPQPHVKCGEVPPIYFFDLRHHEEKHLLGTACLRLGVILPLTVLE